MKQVFYDLYNYLNLNLFKNLTKKSLEQLLEQLLIVQLRLVVINGFLALQYLCKHTGKLSFWIAKSLILLIHLMMLMMI